MYQLVDSWQQNSRGAHYGDGVFTTMLVKGGVVQLFDYHIQRLNNDTRVLGLPKPCVQTLEAVVQTAKNMGSGVLKLVLNAGVGGRGYARPSLIQPTALLFSGALPSYYASWQTQGINVTVSSVKLAIQPLLAGIKHLNRLEQVLIKQELQTSHYDDVLVFDTANRLVESSSANVFILNSAGTWQTPHLDGSGVAGTMRRYVMDSLAHENTPVVTTEIHIDAINKARSIMLTNALMGLVPVQFVELDNQQKQLEIEPVLTLSNRLGINT